MSPESVFPGSERFPSDSSSCLPAPAPCCQQGRSPGEPGPGRERVHSHPVQFHFAWLSEFSRNCSLYPHLASCVCVCVPPSEAPLFMELSGSMWLHSLSSRHRSPTFEPRDPPQRAGYSRFSLPSPCPRLLQHQSRPRMNSQGGWDWSEEAPVDIGPFWLEDCTHKGQEARPFGLRGDLCLASVTASEPEPSLEATDCPFTHLSPGGQGCLQSGRTLTGLIGVFSCAGRPLSHGPAEC